MQSQVKAREYFGACEDWSEWIAAAWDCIESGKARCVEGWKQVMNGWAFKVVQEGG